VALGRTDVAALADVGLGARWEPGERFGLRLDARAAYAPFGEEEIRAPRLEVIGGAYVRFSLGDGGAPVRPPDEDFDGVRYQRDWCPDEPEDRDGYFDGDGCPDADNDGDGLSDPADRCPFQAEVVNDVQDEDGCPETDDDGDGVWSGADRCPRVAEDADGHADEDGCPDPDNDGDGITDAADGCAGEAENVNGVDDGDGCPDRAPSALDALAAQREVRFDGKQRPLWASAASQLDPVAKVLASHPEARVRVVVSTAPGAAAVSEQRGQGVVRHLRRRGIAADRLTVVAEDEPAVDEPAAQAGRRRRARAPRPPATSQIRFELAAP
jgi:OOP family OmpA-OmpF porin